MPFEHLQGFSMPVVLLKPFAAFVVEVGQIIHHFFSAEYCFGHVKVVERLFVSVESKQGARSEHAFKGNVHLIANLRKESNRLNVVFHSQPKVAFSFVH